MQPRRRAATIVHCRLVIDRRGGVIEVKTDVVFPRPDDLHRFPKLLGKHRGLGGIVGLRFSSECAAQQSHMTDDILLIHADRCGDGFLDSLWILRRTPYGHFAVLKFGNCHRWFH